jgi:hypothetical protein
VAGFVQPKSDKSAQHGWLNVFTVFHDCGPRSSPYRSNRLPQLAHAPSLQESLRNLLSGN